MVKFLFLNRVYAGAVEYTPMEEKTKDLYI